MNATPQISETVRTPPWGFILRQGVAKGWSGALWMYKVLVPISLLTLILDACHVMDHLDGFLGPVMGTVHLPAKAAMPVLTGLLTGIYGGIASMAVLDFTLREATLIAIFLLISHALPQESAIQGQSGINPLKAAGIRLATSVATVWLIGSFWDGSPAETITAVTTAATPVAPGELFVGWLVQTFWLCAQILCILVGIMILMEWLKACRLSERIAEVLNPLFKLLGLDSQVGLQWLTAALFGISYGGAVIVEETRNHPPPPEILERLHVSMGINHAMIEDPVLFIPLGIHPIWLWLPRLAAAVAAVRLMAVVQGVFAGNRRRRASG